METLERARNGTRTGTPIPTLRRPCLNAPIEGFNRAVSEFFKDDNGEHSFADLTLFHQKPADGWAFYSVWLPAALTWPESSSQCLFQHHPRVPKLVDAYIPLDNPVFLM